MTEKQRLLIDILLAIEAKRGDTRGSTGEEHVWSVLDELEEEILGIAKDHNVKVPA